MVNGIEMESKTCVIATNRRQRVRTVSAEALFAVCCFFVFLFVTSEAETERRKFRRVFNVVLIILGD